MEMNTIADWWKWVELAREDPEQFEKERASTIEEFIMSKPARCRHRSRQLQWKIDTIRQTSPNNLYAFVRLYDLLIDSVYGPKGLLEAIDSRFSSNGASGRNDVSPKKVVFLLDFKRKKG